MKELLLIFALLGLEVNPALGQDKPAPLEHAEALATFHGGKVLASDLERERVFLSRDERQYREIAQFDRSRNEQDWIQRIALRRLASREIAGEIAADPALRELARGQARSFALARWHEACYGLPLVVPSGAELLARLGDVPMLPLRLKVAHIYLKVAPGTDPAPTAERLKTLRSELHSAAEFKAKAREISQSQSRPRGGELGWLRPGSLPKRVEAMLAAMPVGAISEPTELRGGWHLFFLEGRREPEDPRPWRLQRERTRALGAARAACRAEKLAGAPLESRVEGDLLVIGEWSLPLALIPARRDEDAVAARARYIEDEILFQLAQTPSGLSPEEKLRLEDLKGNVYLAHYIEGQAEKRLSEPTSAALRSLFGDGSSYQQPRQLAGTYLKAGVPPGQDPYSFLEKLEAVAAALDSGEKTLTEAKAELGAELFSFELQPQIEVAGLLGPVVFEEVHGQKVGAVSAPVQDGEDFFIVRFEQEEKKRPRTFDEALPDLKRAFRRHEMAGLKEFCVRELLEKGEFHR